MEYSRVAEGTNRLRIHMFGKFSVDGAHGTLPTMDQRKVQELLCYLLLHGDQPHSREVLAALLWAEASTAQARAYLRKALWQLQSGLDAWTGTSPQRMLVANHDWLQINPEVNLWCDVVIFQHAARGVHGVPGEQLDRAAAAAVREAVALYRGDLLEGWYQEWCLYERERLQSAYLALLDKLMAHCEEEREFEHAVAYGAQILRVDRAREQTHRRLMRLHALAGDRTAAVRQFESCAATLTEELGVKPSLATLALIDQIKSNEIVGGLTSPHLSSPKPNDSIGMAQILGHLRQLHERLADVQLSVRHDIEAVEQALSDIR